MDAQLAALDRAVQLTLEVQVLGGQMAHARLVNGVASASGCLGPIQRDVRLAQQVTAGSSQLRAARNADTGPRVSFLAIQRDNGGCPGNGGANNCSGIAQNTWDFSHILEPFTG